MPESIQESELIEALKEYGAQDDIYKGAQFDLVATK